MASKRKDRQHKQSKQEDQRKEFQIDRDRLIYCFAFRRLAQVTQVASAKEGNVFHNRLTHSLKVAQVGRRLAEYLKSESKPNLKKQGEKLSPNVVETACLAHDLGHPPFGHIAEKELDKVAREAGLSDGFEGNAQTFRILTKLEPYKPEYPGLNLTRATLDATLKYPWFRARDNGDIKTKKRAKKFSVYDLDRDIFEFVRSDEKYRESGKKSLEASVMEFADDITYSVHDLEDFYLAGLIPLNLLVQGDDEWDNFITEWIDSLKDSKRQEKLNEQKEGLKSFISYYLLSRNVPNSSIEQITMIRNRSSYLIQYFIQSASIFCANDEKCCYLKRDLHKDIELELLQRIVLKYVITNPRLATQQYGQRKIIRELFNIYKDAIESNQTNLIPSRFLQDGSLPNFLEEGDTKQQKLRLAVDIVASFSESEAVLMYRRLTGLEQGSIMDYIG